MSTASEKNLQALKALFGNDALADRLATTRLAVVTPEQHLPASGKLLGDVLVDLIARLWPNIDFHGDAALELHAAAVSAAISGGASGSAMQVQWAPPYDVVIALGCEPPLGASATIRLGANDWGAELGPKALCGDSSNPVGPAMAAAMGGAQVFHRVFEKDLDGMGTAPIDSWHSDVRDLFGARHLRVADIDLGETHFFGVGAVTHGLMLLLTRWPAQVHGVAHLVDQDRYGSSNGQRYLAMLQQDVGSSKVAIVANRLRAAHGGGLEVHGHPTDLNTYCATRGWHQPLQRVVAGLDSAEARRHVAFKMPERAINMWTAGERTGAGRYLPRSGSACLACEYLEKAGVLLDEVGELHLQTGLRPDIVRVLLDSGRGMTQVEAAQLASKWGVSPADFVGQPLRSAMPALCATGRLQLPNNPEAVDVPFAFASLFAGIAGFMMLLKDLAADGAPSESWTQHNFKPPTPLLLRQRPSSAHCVCCSALRTLEDARKLTVVAH